MLKASVKTTSFPEKHSLKTLVPRRLIAAAGTQLGSVETA